MTISKNKKALLETVVAQFVKEALSKAEEVDVALVKSDKRRADFKKQWKDENPPKKKTKTESVKSRKRTLMLREMIVLHKMLLSTIKEQVKYEPPVPDPNAAPPAADPNAAPAAPGAPGAAPTDPTSTAPVDPNAAPADPSMGALGGMPDMGSAGATGGGMGDVGGEPPPDADAGALGGELGAAGGGDEGEGGDPISGIVDAVKTLLNDTRDVPTLLKSIKAEIQDKFDEPEHAIGLVKALYKTGDETLKSVALRLYQFIQTGTPSPELKQTPEEQGMTSTSEEAPIEPAGTPIPS